MGAARSALVRGHAVKFEFDLGAAAANNSDNAKLREATRLAAIAYGLSVLGHDARIVAPGKLLPQSPRWKHFKHLSGGHNGGLMVLPAETLSSRKRRCDIAVKCSVGTKNDETYLDHCRLLMAHESSLHGHERVLSVPFLIHDDMVIELEARGLLAAYLNDDLTTVRAAFDYTKTGWVGLRGTGWQHRTQFLENAPEWVDVAFHRMGQPPMNAWAHAEWLCRFRGALALPGDTPKTNLTPLLAMLGVPIISYEVERNTPQLDGRSMILFESWDGVRSQLDDQQRYAQLVDEETIAYLDGWSPIGQARQIARRFE